MRVRAGNQQSGDVEAIDFGPSASLVDQGSSVVVTPAAFQSYQAQPSDQQLLGWSFDPVMVGGGQAPSAGVFHYGMVRLPEVVTIANAACFIQQAGSGAQLPVNCFLAVYNSAGTRIGVSAALDTPFQSTGFKAASLVVDGGQTLTQGGSRSSFVWVGLVIGTQSTTNVQLYRGGGGTQGVGGAGQTANTNSLRFGFSGSSLTAAPTSFTPLSGQGQDYAWWFAVQ